MKFTGLSIATGGAACALMASGPASAAQVTDTFQVAATVTTNCNITADDIAFGIYSVLDTTDTDNSASAVHVTCTKGATFSVTLDAGSNAGSSTDFANRAMEENGAGTALLNYQIYTDSGHTTVWGDGTTGGSGKVTDTSASATVPTDITMYARIPAGQNVPAAGYTDATVTATVTF